MAIASRRTDPRVQSIKVERPRSSLVLSTAPFAFGDPSGKRSVLVSTTRNVYRVELDIIYCVHAGQSGVKFRPVRRYIHRGAQ